MFYTAITSEIDSWDTLSVSLIQRRADEKNLNGSFCRASHVLLYNFNSVF